MTSALWNPHHEESAKRGRERRAKQAKEKAVGPFLTSRQAAVLEALSAEKKQEIHEAARAAAVAVMERFERDRGRR